MTSTEVNLTDTTDHLFPPRPKGWRRHKSLISTVSVFVVLILLPQTSGLGWFTSTFDSSNNFGRGNLAFVFAFAAAAIGFNLLVGYSGTLGLAVAGLFGLGAYGTAILSAPKECLAEGCDPVVREALSGYAWPFFFAVPVVCVAAAVIGVVVGFPAARLKGFFLAIATLALGELIVTLIRLDDDVWSGLKTNGGTGKQVPQFIFPDLPDILFLDRIFPDMDRAMSSYIMSLGALLITFIGYVILTEKRLGRTLKSVRDIDIATGPIGISSTYYKLVAFGLSSFAAALAGAAWAQNSSFVNPAVFKTRLLIFLLIVLIVGGLGRLWGPLVGAIFFVWLRQELQSTQKLLFLILGVALMLAVLLMPHGITSLPERIKDSRWAEDMRRRRKTIGVK